MSDRLIAVFGSSALVAASPEWIHARTVGAQIASAGYGLITGGYEGVMGAASEGASRYNVAVVGVIAPDLFPDRPGPNRHVTNLVEADTITGRIRTLIDLSLGAVCLPGSVGTATELLTSWNVNAIGDAGSSYPIAAVGPVWRDLGELIGITEPPHDRYAHFCDHASDAVRWVIDTIESSKSGF